MKDGEKLYTVTVDTKQGKRIVVLPKNSTIKCKRTAH